MFGIGYQEMFVVLVVALIIFGPSRLPELAGQLGRWVRDFRRMSADLTGEFEKTFAEVDEVKKSFKREMQSIQDEVEGVGRSARGDLKKSTAKSTAASKKATGGALKSGAAGTGTEATKTGSDEAAKPATAARPKMPALDARKRAGARTANGSAGERLVATKSDPLVDVSFFDAEASIIVSSNGAPVALNGAASAEVDDALSRVRKRRAAAAYGRQASV